MLKPIILGLALAFAGGIASTSSAADAPAKQEKKVDKKCDAAGKECKEGDNCKPENCPKPKGAK